METHTCVIPKTEADAAISMELMENVRVLIPMNEQTFLQKQFARHDLGIYSAPGAVVSRDQPPVSPGLLMSATSLKRLNNLGTT